MPSPSPSPKKASEAPKRSLLPALGSTSSSGLLDSTPVVDP